jgi:hypothetical protein
VSASEEGDYYQVWLEVKNSAKDAADPHEVNGPYVIVQRDFEMPDDGRCYVETHDSNYIGHFRLRLIEFSLARLAFELGRKRNNYMEVSFAMDESEFKAARRIVKIVFGVREPDAF